MTLPIVDWERVDIPWALQNISTNLLILALPILGYFSLRDLIRRNTGSGVCMILTLLGLVYLGTSEFSLVPDPSYIFFHLYKVALLRLGKERTTAIHPPS